jgi:peptide deformylase
MTETDEVKKRLAELETDWPIVKDRVFLKKVSEEFDFQQPQTDPIELARLLTDKMDSVKGLGLSAIQIGIPLRVFVMRTDPRLVVFNPKVIDYGDAQVEMEEGCLSFPNMVLKVKRPQNIKVQFTFPNGQTDTYKYGDMTARIFQHEIDHLDGTLFFERVSRYHRDKAFRNKERLDKLHARQRGKALEKA